MGKVARLGPSHGADPDFLSQMVQNLLLENESYISKVIRFQAFCWH